MKRFLIVGLFLFAVIGSAAAAERSLLARVTVYWASGGSGSDRWTRRHIAASGTRLRNGHCAVDPRQIPYGSKVKLADGTLVAVDTGTALRSRRAARLSGRSPTEKSAIVIDRFFETKAEALAWARRNPQFMSVRIAPANAQSVNVGSTFGPRTSAGSQPVILTMRRVAGVSVGSGGNAVR